MNRVSAIALFVMALSVSVTAWAEESAGGNNEPPAETEGKKADDSTDTKPDQKTEPKPKAAEGSEEPGCSE
ncbi:MAG: hypothetical protein QG652_1068 [Pseudomonadota bacterium]|nr:hypothetical protein [Pseudomonadota bacterium]